MRNAVVLAVGLSSLFSCQDTSHVDPGQSRSAGDLLEAPNEANDPQLMIDRKRNQNYETRFDRLKLAAELEETPWTDYYWPTKNGGISYRYNHKDKRDQKVAIGYELMTEEQVRSMSREDLVQLSPAEKYDIYLGQFRDNLPEDSRWVFTRYERVRTAVFKTIPGMPEFEDGYKIPSWEGICHAWAPATLAFQEPHPVDVRGFGGVTVPFGASDIKAMLSFYLHISGPASHFLGERCYLSDESLAKLTQRFRNQEISKEEYMEARRSCDDTNAGSFHTVIANQIGRLGEGFIADVTREDEVWNQPVYKYESKIVDDRRVSKQQAEARNDAPGTVREVELVTKMYYSVEIQPTFARTGKNTTSIEYHYQVELDRHNNIIGGAWASEEANRPDFLWKYHRTPNFRGPFGKSLSILYYRSLAAGRRSTEPLFRPLPI